MSTEVLPPNYFDEVAGEYQAPAPLRRARLLVVGEQSDQIVVHASRATNRLTDVVEIAPKVHVREDEQALHDDSKSKIRTVCTL